MINQVSHVIIEILNDHLLLNQQKDDDLQSLVVYVLLEIIYLVLLYLFNGFRSKIWVTCFYIG